MTIAKLLLVEDDKALSELLLFHLDKAGYEVRHTEDGDEALIMVKEELPDIILLDWMVIGVSGIEICRRLRKIEASAAIPIIMLTARGEEEDRLQGFATGVDDYVTKPFSPRELLARIDAVLRRSRPSLTASTLNYADIVMDVEAHRVKRAGDKVELGPTEFRLLRHFIANPGRVYSREQLQDAVWGINSDIELRTVDVHIRRLRKALNEGGKPDLIRTVHATGYALELPTH